MTLLHQAAQKAVEALTFARRSLAPYGGNSAPIEAALAALESALQQQPEPVATEEAAYQRGKRAGYIDGYRAAHADERQQPDISPALQHQEVPREPVAHFPIIYAILRPALSTGNIAVRQHAERLAEVLEGDQLAAVRELLDRQPATSEPARVIHAASPSTTRQQEVGSDWRPIESAPKDGTWIAAIGHLGKDTPDTLKWRDGYWWNGYDNYSHEPTHWMPLAAAPSTPEKAGGVSDGVGDPSDPPICADTGKPKHPGNCWNVRCQLGGTCCRAMTPDGGSR